MRAGLFCGHPMQRTELESYLNQYLEVDRFRDYCPNGLQVEGRPEVRSIVSGVTVRGAAGVGKDGVRRATMELPQGLNWSDATRQRRR